MDGEQLRETPTEPLSERDKHVLRTYGKLPRRDLLGLRAKKRGGYFDSGDFALSAASKTSEDNGAVQPGTAHPVRASISHPYAPLPGTSNAPNNANESVYGDKHPSPEIAKSPLGYETQPDEEYFWDSKGA
ncbi:uncharacterized protein BDW70DRAFT_161920 [Aspergillus foveolatus]|uniref:uncharacterized protein n=1 Tax=Aspergillus foveolatus TaxID=210207 RepID=UPI003CCC90CF